MNFSNKLLFTRVFGHVFLMKFAASHLKFNGVNHDYVESTHAASFVYQKIWRRRLLFNTFFRAGVVQQSCVEFANRKLEIYPGVCNFEVNSEHVNQKIEILPFPEVFFNISIWFYLNLRVLGETLLRESLCSHSKLCRPFNKSWFREVTPRPIIETMANSPICLQFELHVVFGFVWNSIYALM